MTDSPTFGLRQTQKNTHFVVANGSIFDSRRERLIVWCNSDEEIEVIPEGVRIDSFCYFRPDWIWSGNGPWAVVVPSSVKILGVNVFPSLPRSRKTRLHRG
jgi:hypothetical protein